IATSSGPARPPWPGCSAVRRRPAPVCPLAAGVESSSRSDLHGVVLIVFARSDTAGACDDADTGTVPVLVKSFRFKGLDDFAGQFPAAARESERPISRQAVSV